LCGNVHSQVAVAWLVYRLTRTAWVLGVVGVAGQIPMFLLAPFAGVWVDRWNQRRLLVVTQALSLLQSFGLAAAAFVAHGSHAPPLKVILGEIIALPLLQGLINWFAWLVRLALLVC